MHVVTPPCLFSIFCHGLAYAYSVLALQLLREKHSLQQFHSKKGVNLFLRVVLLWYDSRPFVMFLLEVEIVCKLSSGLWEQAN